jgi:hypothetical protein
MGATSTTSVTSTPAHSRTITFWQSGLFAGRLFRCSSVEQDNSTDPAARVCSMGGGSGWSIYQTPKQKSRASRGWPGADLEPQFQSMSEVRRAKNWNEMERN